MKHIKIYLIVFAAALLLHACSPSEGNSTGHEYMPDMAHSVAYEANTYNYYYYNTWDQASTFTTKELTRAGEPVKGTVPRGYAGVYFAQNGTAQNAVMEELHGETTLNAISVPINGSVPYYYQDTPEERQRAIAEIIENPFPITADGLERGKNLYDIFCAICHGEKGNGMGYLANPDENPNAKYLAVPANLISTDFKNSSNGRLYHAIMYGLNVMGGYSDKMSYEERWQVIHYIRSLQAKDSGLAYDETTNTLNADYGMPAGTESAIAQGPMTDDAAAPSEAGAGEDQSGSEH